MHNRTQNTEFFPKETHLQSLHPTFCSFQLGTAVHEIGHALGLWHQHQRPSRDESITVHNDEIASWARSNFVKVPMENVNEYNLPYDYNSIMHYSGIVHICLAWLIPLPSELMHVNVYCNARFILLQVGTKDGKYTITTHDPLFQNNLGQRYQLSFLDAKIINLAYCQGTSALLNACRYVYMIVVPDFRVFNLFSSR